MTISIALTYLGPCLSLPLCIAGPLLDHTPSHNAQRKWVVLLSVTDLFQILCVSRLYNKLLNIPKKTVLLWKQTSRHL